MHGWPKVPDGKSTLVEEENVAEGEEGEEECHVSMYIEQDRSAMRPGASDHARPVDQPRIKDRNGQPLVQIS